MPEDRHVDDAITNGALPPSVARAAAALRAAVPVRAEWRASVLAEVARVARDDGMTGPAAIRGGRPPASRGRRWARLTVAWPVAIACGVLVFAAGVLAARVAGGSRSVGESRRPAAATDAPRRGTTRFVLVAPNAQRVALVGDFNLWNPASAPMRRMAGTGEWEIDLPLPAGRHAYAFVVDGDVTADPSAPRTAGDDYGRPNSVVLVSSPRS